MLLDLPRELVCTVAYWAAAGLLPLKGLPMLPMRHLPNELGSDEASVVTYLREHLVRPLLAMRATCTTLYTAEWLPTAAEHLFDWVYTQRHALFARKAYFMRDLYPLEVTPKSPPALKRLALTVKLAQPEETVLHTVPLARFDAAHLRNHEIARIAALTRTDAMQWPMSHDSSLLVQYLIRAAKRVRAEPGQEALPVVLYLSPGRDDAGTADVPHFLDEMDVVDGNVDGGYPTRARLGDRRLDLRFTGGFTSLHAIKQRDATASTSSALSG